MSLNSILKDREKSYNYLIKLINHYKKPVITIKLNIPGMIKNKEIYSLFLERIWMQFYKLNIFKILFYKYKKLVSGNAYFIVLDQENPIEIKNKLLAIEKQFPFNRIIDFDVYNLDYKPIKRLNGRLCLICDNNWADCRYNKNHSLEELINFIDKNIENILIDKT